jgi:hypothetical protein
MKMFKQVVDGKDSDIMRQWARDNYKPLEPIEGTWHPIVQHECVKMNWDADVPTEIQQALVSAYINGENDDQ